MLQTIRDHAQGWIAWVIVGLIIITFALFGIEQYAQGPKTIVVAEVNGEEVTDAEFLTLYNRQKNRLQQQFGEMYDQVVQDEVLRDQVLDSLIQSKLIKQWSEAHNMGISDGQLAATIHAASVFHKDGQFDEETYKTILRNNNLNVARFEQEQRQVLTEQQNTQLTAASYLSSQFLTDQLAQLQFQTRSAQTLTLAKAALLADVEVSKAQIEDYYQANLADFEVPKQVKVDYIELSQANLAKALSVTDSELQAYYDENLARFVEPEKRQASHILIRMDAQTPEAEAQAQAKLSEVQQALSEGQAFAELAKQYSQDPGSAKQGGALGLFQQGMMVPEFDEAVFSMKVDEVSEPVKTDFGYHLIKLEKVVAKLQKPFADVKADVEAQYRSQAAEKMYFEQLEQLNALAYEQPDSLQPAAEALGLTIQKTDFFSQSGGEGIAQNSDVISAAFSEDVLMNRVNSASIDLEQNRAVVLHLAELEPARQKALTEVEAEIRQRLQDQQAMRLAKKQAEALMAKVASGEAMASLTSEGVTFVEAAALQRQNNQLNAEVTEKLFKLPKPTSDQASLAVMSLANGDAVVIALTEVQAGEMPKTGAEGLEAQLKQTISQLMAGVESDARTKALLETADIEKLAVYLTVK